MVHPHSRGENYPPAADDAVCLGSSPLARGKLMCIVCSVRRRRFIPTRAGKIVRRVSGRLCAGVHPHSRGENLELDIQTKEQEGSSPLARGKFYGGESSDYRMRFIPTRAGKMLNRPSRWLWPGVHPHSRGENQQVVACCGGCLGSSPLARGKFGSRPESISLRRFIPTRAGKILVDWVVYPLGLSDFGNPRLARRRLSKSLIPRRRLVLPAGAVSSGSSGTTPGRTMSVKPSKSVGTHGSPHVRKDRPCSFLALKTMMARPVPIVSTTICHSLSRTRALRLPTNTPGDICNSHLVTCPRNPSGTAERTSTTIRHHQSA